MERDSVVYIYGNLIYLMDRHYCLFAVSTSTPVSVILRHGMNNRDPQWLGKHTAESPQIGHSYAHRLLSLSSCLASEHLPSLVLD